MADFFHIFRHEPSPMHFQHQSTQPLMPYHSTQSYSTSPQKNPQTYSTSPLHSTSQSISRTDPRNTSHAQPKTPQDIWSSSSGPRSSGVQENDTSRSYSPSTRQPNQARPHTTNSLNVSQQKMMSSPLPGHQQPMLPGHQQPVRQSSSQAAPFQHTQFGVGIEFENGRLVVASLVPGCSAAKSNQIQVGDEMVAVEGYEDLDFGRARSLILGRQGTCVTLTFRRRLQRFKVKLMRGASEYLEIADQAVASEAKVLELEAQVSRLISENEKISSALQVASASTVKEGQGETGHQQEYIASLQASIRDLQGEIEGQKKESEAAQSLLQTQKNEELRLRNNENDLLRMQVSSLQKLIGEKDGQVTQTKAKAREQQTAMAARVREAEEMLKERVAAKNERITDLSNQLADAQTEIEGLRAEAQRLKNRQLSTEPRLEVGSSVRRREELPDDPSTEGDSPLKEEYCRDVGDSDSNQEIDNAISPRSGEDWQARVQESIARAAGERVGQSSKAHMVPKLALPLKDPLPTYQLQQQQVQFQGSADTAGGGGAASGGGVGGGGGAGGVERTRASNTDSGGYANPKLQQPGTLSSSSSTLSSSAAFPHGGGGGAGCGMPVERQVEAHSGRQVLNEPAPHSLPLHRDSFRPWGQRATPSSSASNTTSATPANTSVAVSSSSSSLTQPPDAPRSHLMTSPASSASGSQRNTQASSKASSSPSSSPQKPHHRPPHISASSSSATAPSGASVSAASPYPQRPHPSPSGPGLSDRHPPPSSSSIPSLPFTPMSTPLSVSAPDVQLSGRPPPARVNRYAGVGVGGGSAGSNGSYGANGSSSYMQPPQAQAQDVWGGSGTHTPSHHTYSSLQQPHHAQHNFSAFPQQMGGMGGGFGMDSFHHQQMASSINYSAPGQFSSSWRHW